ncbi:MAG: hypothetical protein JOY79_07820 [Acidobacteriaceae bacterium]|nr:hypothetical protein [Acidobacteriaceae bacterium]
MFGPILMPPIVDLPSPVEPMGVITYGPLAPIAPLVSTPVLDFGWTSTFVGASNGTPGNQVGATNSTLAGMLNGTSTPSEVVTRRATGRFNTGAAYYTAVSYGDQRSLGEVAARLKKQPKQTPRVYTNDDISRLKTPQPGSTLGPQTVTPTPSNPNLPQEERK